MPNLRFALAFLTTILAAVNFASRATDVSVQLTDPQTITVSTSNTME